MEQKCSQYFVYLLRFDGMHHISLFKLIHMNRFDLLILSILAIGCVQDTWCTYLVMCMCQYQTVEVKIYKI